MLANPLFDHYLFTLEYKSSKHQAYIYINSRVANGWYSLLCTKGSRVMVSEMLSITLYLTRQPLAEWWLFRRATMPGPNFVRVCCSFQFPLAVMYRFTRLTRTLPRTALVLPRRKYSTGLGI